MSHRTDSRTEDKLPPHSTEAEEGVIGCILLNPTDCMMRCISQFPGAEVFFNATLRTVYQLLLVMHEDRDPIDLITLQQRLRDANELEAVGGLPYLSQLPDAVPTAHHLDYYIPIVADKFKRRRMMQACGEIVRRCADEDDEEAEGQIEAMQRDLVRLAQMGNGKGDWQIKQALRDAIKAIETDIKTGWALTGLSTGFDDFDRKTRGLQKDDLIVIAARPGLGKTSIACNIADHAAVDCGLPVGIISLEMSKESLMRRMLSARSKINLRIENDLYANQQLSQVSSAAGKLAIAPLYMDDTPGMDDVQVRSVLRQMFHEHGIKLAIVDYLQRLSTRKRFDNRAQEVAHISNGMKDLARELHIPVLVCAQLNREVENRKNERPRISDLKESGGIEQDADLIGLLYATKAEDEDSETQIPMALYIGKARNGPTGTIRLLFQKDIFRFLPMPKIRDQDVPKT